MDKLTIMWTGALNSLERTSANLKDYCSSHLVPEDKIEVVPYEYKGNKYPASEIDMSVPGIAVEIIDRAVALNAQVIAFPYGWPIPGGLFDQFKEKGLNLIMECPCQYPSMMVKVHKTVWLQVSYANSTPGYAVEVEGWKLITGVCGESDDEDIVYNYTTEDFDPADIMEKTDG